MAQLTGRMSLTPSPTCLVMMQSVCFNNIQNNLPNSSPNIRVFAQVYCRMTSRILVTSAVYLLEWKRVYLIVHSKSRSFCVLMPHPLLHLPLYLTPVVSNFLSWMYPPLTETSSTGKRFGSSSPCLYMFAPISLTQRNSLICAMHSRMAVLRVLLKAFLDQVIITMKPSPV